MADAKKLDIHLVAKRAGVSTATVSRAINRIPTVNPRLAKRVWRAIKELGYYPNTQARALVSGRSRTFGLVVSELTNPFFPEIVQVFESIAVQNHYEILLASTMNDAERVKVLVRRMLERRVDGVAVMTFGMEDALLEDLQIREIPLVFVDVGPSRPRVSNIRIDYLSGIREAMQHLVGLGHRKIAFISGPPTQKTARARIAAYHQCVEELGLKADAASIVEGDHTMEGGREACAKLFSSGKRPTAILCSNDMTAFGVLRKSYEDKIKVPSDLSVIGFDDIRFAKYILPPLTTVQMSQAELARIAFEALLSEVGRHSPLPEGASYELTTSLILRESTAACRQ